MTRKILVKKPSLLIPLFFVLVSVGCDMFNSPLKSFIDRSTNVAIPQDHYFLTDFYRNDGFVAIPPGLETRIRIPLHNPRGHGLSLSVENAPYEVTVELDGDAAVVSISGPQRGELFDLVLSVQDSVTGRLMPSYYLPRLEARFLNANLQSLLVTSPPGIILSPGFAPGHTSYTATVPYGTPYLYVSAALPPGVYSTAALRYGGGLPVPFAGDSILRQIPVSAGAAVITIEVTAESGFQRTYTLTVTEGIALPPLTGTVSITGTAQEGQTLTADTSALGGDGDYSFQWRRGDVNVGADSSTYIVQPGDIGYTLTVTVMRTGNSGSVTSPPTAVVTASPLPPLTGTVSITGTAQVGQTLTADTSALEGTGDISFQWRRGDVNIGTNSNTYLVQPEDIGSTITVTVMRTGNSASVTSPPTAVVADLPALTGTVSIEGTAQVGQILTADTTALGGDGEISFQWNRGNAPIAGATGSAYTLQAADVGYVITVTVTRAGNSASVTSLPTAVVILPPLTGTVSITGTPQEGQTLTADTSALGGAGD